MESWHHTCKYLSIVIFIKCTKVQFTHSTNYEFVEWVNCLKFCKIYFETNHFLLYFMSGNNLRIFFFVWVCENSQKPFPRWFIYKTLPLIKVWKFETFCKTQAETDHLHMKVSLIRFSFVCQKLKKEDNCLILLKLVKMLVYVET